MFCRIRLSYCLLLYSFELIRIDSVCDLGCEKPVLSRSGLGIVLVLVTKLDWWCWYLGR